mmetsp:Transcript_32088/g.88662  ORF Transcript_32088/g.88662 Transcript_32088/m.88662 type:complete len:244 (-) Transcript_32088:478-1209(-)
MRKTQKDAHAVLNLDRLLGPQGQPVHDDARPLSRGRCCAELHAGSARRQASHRTHLGQNANALEYDVASFLVAAQPTRATRTSGGVPVQEVIATTLQGIVVGEFRKERRQLSMPIFGMGCGRRVHQAELLRHHTPALGHRLGLSHRVFPRLLVVSDERLCIQQFLALLGPIVFRLGKLLAERRQFLLEILHNRASRDQVRNWPRLDLLDRLCESQRRGRVFEEGLEGRDGRQKQRSGVPDQRL